MLNVITFRRCLLEKSNGEKKRMQARREEHQEETFDDINPILDSKVIKYKVYWKVHQKLLNKNHFSKKLKVINQIPQKKFQLNIQEMMNTGLTLKTAIQVVILNKLLFNCIL